MIFSLDDLSKVTDNFSKRRMIGNCGFGRVFCGKLETLRSGSEGFEHSK